MRERGAGLLVALVAVAVTYALTHLSIVWGWYMAAVFVGMLGWIIGGYVRELRRMAERDQLTGLCNRRPFERALEREWERAVRGGRSLSLLFLDIDDFGAINKQYGHLAGDEALRTIGRQIRQNLRRSDLLARWGGEEFVVLLPDTDISYASAVAERIRSVVEQCPIRSQGQNIRITVSTGVAAYPGDAHSGLDLLRQAIAGQMMAKVQKNAVGVVS